MSHEILSPELLRRGLETSVLGASLYVYPSVTSTNDIALSLARSGAPEGTVVVADEQTAGRGRHGRRWMAPRGTALLVSILLRPNLPVAQSFILTMLAGVAAARAMSSASHVAVALKWPNDVMIRGRKAGGILTETAIVGDTVTQAIIGIGLNINIPRQELVAITPPATSLLAELGHPISRTVVFRALLREMDNRLPLLRIQPIALFSEWRSLLETCGQRVVVNSADLVVEGVATDVTPEGALLVRDDAGIIHTIRVGDVLAVRPAPGDAPMLR